jgi:hypothetical protein
VSYDTGNGDDPSFGDVMRFDRTNGISELAAHRSLRSWNSSISADGHTIAYQSYPGVFLVQM